MRRVCQYKKFVIYELTTKEREEYGFNYAPVHPDSFGYGCRITPEDADLECYSLEDAKAHIDWFFSDKNEFCDCMY